MSGTVPLLRTDGPAAARLRLRRPIPSMLQVLRHYLPVRKALLIVSETVLLTVVLLLGMSAHLWQVDERLQRELAKLSLDPNQALWMCGTSAFLAAVLAQIAISFNELYDFRISGSRYDRAARFLGSAGSAVLLVASAVSLARLFDLDTVLAFPGLPFSQTIVWLAVSLGVAFALLYLWRNLFHAWMRRSRYNQRLLILGSGRFAERLIDELRLKEDSGYEIAAILSPVPELRERRRSDRRGAERRGTGNPWFDAGMEESSSESSRDVPDEPSYSIPRLVLESGGALATQTRKTVAEPQSSERVELREPLHALATRLDVSDIVVAFHDRRGSLPTEELLRCRLFGMTVHEAESFFEQVSGKIPAEAMRPSYLIFNRGFVQHPLAQLGKRVFDVVLGLLVFASTWPLMIAAAIAIKIDSPGPILFRQERTGQHGRTFTLCKFRSMRADAEKHTGPVWAQENDPRVTRVGNFLRKSRIDELPQLFNVLAGSMSFVGPRPERPTFVDDLAEQLPYYNQRHIVKPGLTGWAQINYPYGNTVEDALQKLQYDLFYIKYQSLLFDVSIVVNTLRTVVLRKGT